jgi:hypothetical protein
MVDLNMRVQSVQSISDADVCLSVCLYLLIKLQGEDAEIPGPDISHLANTHYVSTLHVSVRAMGNEQQKSGKKKRCLFAKS